MLDALRAPRLLVGVGRLGPTNLPDPCALPPCNLTPEVRNCNLRGTVVQRALSVVARALRDLELPGDGQTH